jgi:hypothetical protein
LRIRRAVRDGALHGGLQARARLPRIELQAQLLAGLDGFVQIVDARDLPGPAPLATHGVELPAADIGEESGLFQQLLVILDELVALLQLGRSLSHARFQLLVGLAQPAHRALAAVKQPDAHQREHHQRRGDDQHDLLETDEQRSPFGRRDLGGHHQERVFRH